MRCTNCGKEIPESAKMCQFCEARVETPPSEDMIQVAQEILGQMDPEIRQEFEALCRRAGTGEELANLILVGPCPKCGSEDTGHCEDDPDIKDIITGRCYTCGQLWCTMCDALLTADAPHCTCSGD